MAHAHQTDAPETMRCQIVTVSDTRSKENDKSGQLMKEFAEAENVQIKDYQIVKDEKREIRQALDQGVDHPDIDVILLNGGTGIAKRDVTIEVVEHILDKQLPGFGEMFRMLSYQEDIGSAAILSRALAGVANDTAIFATPGSSGAVKLAMEKLIMPEMKHIVSEIQKD
ncbi:molybdenum cofactor synthesis protein [Gracilibacillus halophilus YIM-C55.5]|uniref:Molybdenum cofactor biosynthesis protein B n=1 Tax=Gracilibacillus halophilus YIM-C55.5 TaxID=1308866 RepID=N4W924_9BACI|nr:molybdenum cofactor biosynthesis protein B [Gracilibacillus halophilus]ENH95739.1 molybdenum cofactor synthesis protein [Gracilibacillus halophilus YIM-C55.5]